MSEFPKFGELTDFKKIFASFGENSIDPKTHTIPQRVLLFFLNFSGFAKKNRIFSI